MYTVKMMWPQRRLEFVSNGFCLQLYVGRCRRSRPIDRGGAAPAVGGHKEGYGSRGCRFAIGVEAVEVIETFIRGEVFSCVLIGESPPDRTRCWHGPKLSAVYSAPLTRRSRTSLDGAARRTPEFRPLRERC